MRELTNRELTTWLRRALIDGQNSNFAERLQNGLWRLLGPQIDDRTINIHESMKVLAKVSVVQEKEIWKYVSGETS